MKKSPQRINPRKLFIRRMIMIPLSLMVIGGTIAVVHAYHKQQESFALSTSAQTRLNDLQTRQRALETEVSTLSTDRGKEGVLRTQYAMGEPGEEVIQIIDLSSSTPPATTTSKNWISHAFSWW